MALLGHAALAMWWDIAADVRDDFAHWHLHEHFPERLAIPGFLRATRWMAEGGGEGVFVLYELADHAVLGSPGYLARLNAPSPWSVRLMPQHRRMVRAQCRVLSSHGGVAASRLATIRLAPGADRADAIREATEPIAARAAGEPGLFGVHLLRHGTPAIAATTEQRLRGLADAAADCVLVVSGSDAGAIERICDEVLAAAGIDADDRQRFEIAVSATPGDMAPRK